MLLLSISLLSVLLLLMLLLLGGLSDISGCNNLPVNPICTSQASIPADDLRDNCRWTFATGFRNSLVPKIQSMCQGITTTMSLITLNFSHFIILLIVSVKQQQR